MTAKQFKGKAIYNPSGRAGEYSYWACNFYNGCSNNCDYCYCKRGVMSSVWSEEPYLKKKFKDDDHAFEIFQKELEQNLSELQKHGLFFSFTTDPMLESTIILTLDAASNAVLRNVPVKILTKRAEWVDKFIKEFDRNEANLNHEVNGDNPFVSKKPLWAFGFTLTGHDELETGASTNAERIEAMRKLHEAGFRTWASIEPTIILSSSRGMISLTIEFCDMYKIGLLSGKKFDRGKLQMFVEDVCEMTAKHDNKVYFKDGLIQQAGISRDQLPANCVGRDYNIFK